MPVRGDETTANFMGAQGFERTRSEPRWFVRRSASNLKARVLVEVDDGAIAFQEGRYTSYLEPFRERFTIGKTKRFDPEWVDYISRRFRMMGGRILVDQE
eukprot:4023683-Pyramimonas_sp.AAC.1